MNRWLWCSLMVASVSLAHGGEDHGTAPPAPVQGDGQRATVARGPTMDVVMRWPSQPPGVLNLRLLLSDVDGNAPLEGATITLHTTQPGGAAGPTASFSSTPSPGVYQSQMTIAQVGEHAGTVTVVVGDRIESVPLPSMVMGAEVDDHHDHDDRDRSAAWLWPVVVAVLIVATLWGWRRRLGASVGLMLVTAAGGYAHGDDHAPVPVSGPSSATVVTLSKESQFLLGIRTSKAVRATLSDELLVAGKVVAPPAGHAAIVASQPGRVVVGSNGDLTLGSTVKKGQLLCIIDAAVNVGERAGLAIAAAQADSEVAAAEAALEAATKQLERMAALADVVSQRQRDDAAVDVSASTAALRAARAKRDAYGAGSQPTRMVMRSPIDGVVADVDVSPGELLPPGHRLFLIVDPRTLWVEARVPEASIAMVNIGAVVTLESDARPGAAITGKVMAVGEVVDDRSRTIKAIIAVDNRDRLLKVGMFTQVRFSHGSAIETLTLPRTAVLDVEGRATVFVHIAPERFERRTIAIGRGDLQTIEVRGVSAGEHIAVSGLLSLQHAPPAPTTAP